MFKANSRVTPLNLGNLRCKRAHMEPNQWDFWEGSGVKKHTKQKKYLLVASTKSKQDVKTSFKTNIRCFLVTVDDLFVLDIHNSRQFTLATYSVPITFLSYRNSWFNTHLFEPTGNTWRFLLFCLLHVTERICWIKIKLFVIFFLFL